MALHKQKIISEERKKILVGYINQYPLPKSKSQLDELIFSVINDVIHETEEQKDLSMMELVAIQSFVCGYVGFIKQ